MTEPGARDVDLHAVLAAMQDQLDDLTATVEAQHARIAELERIVMPRAAERD